MICSAKSLNLALNLALPWVFHDDGTLSTHDCQLLALHFPRCRLIKRTDADLAFEGVKAQFPELYELRAKHVLLLKVADLYMFSEKKRLLFVDSDVLCIKKPGFILSKLQEEGVNYFNKDVATAYVNSPEVLFELVGVSPFEQVNSGLSILNRSDLSMDRIAATLSGIHSSKRSDWNSYNHLIEQTTIAILATKSAFGVEHLPCEYDVSLEAPIKGFTCRHFVGVIRHLYELQGLRYLIQQMSFFERWQEFSSQR